MKYINKLSRFFLIFAVLFVACEDEETLLQLYYFSAKVPVTWKRLNHKAILASLHFLYSLFTMPPQFEKSFLPENIFIVSDR